MSPWLEMVLRLLLATALGAGIGYQRERAGKAAGLRDHVLITLGAALFAVISICGFSGAVDSSRVAAGVVVGVGFRRNRQFAEQAKPMPEFATEQRPVYYLDVKRNAARIVRRAHNGSNTKSSRGFITEKLQVRSFL